MATEHNTDGKSLLDQYLRMTLEHGRVRDGIWMVAVIERLRPGAIVGTARDTPRFSLDKFDQLCTSFALSSTEAFKQDRYICREKQRLTRLPDEREWTEEYHTMMGDFLGYPDECVASYIRNQVHGTAPVNQEYYNEFAADDLAYLSFVPFFPRPTKTGVRYEINRGKRMCNLLSERCDRWGSSALQQSITVTYYRGQMRAAAMSPNS